MLVNVDSEMKDNMKRDLKMTLYTANKLKSFKKIPEVFFVFNKSSKDTPEKRKELMVQVQGINDKIVQGIEILNKNSKDKNVLKFDLNEEKIIILTQAYEERVHQIDPSLGRNKQFTAKICKILFANETSKLSRRVLDYICKREDTVSNDLKKYIHKANQAWIVTENFADLTKLDDVDSILHKEIVKNCLEDIVKETKVNEIFGEKIKELSMQTQGLFERGLNDLKNEIDFDEVLEKNLEELNKSVSSMKNTLETEFKKDYEIAEGEDFIREIIKTFELKVLDFENNFRNERNLYKLKKIEKSIYNIDKHKAEQLKNNKAFQNLSEKGKIEEITKTFEAMFKNISKDLEDNFNIKTIQVKTYK